MIDDVKVFHVAQATPVCMAAVPSEVGASNDYRRLTSSLAASTSMLTQTAIVKNAEGGGGRERRTDGPTDRQAERARERRTDGRTDRQTQSFRYLINDLVSLLSKCPNGHSVG